jgi:glycosyltransferase A (GT-A) superfamily protein (DUF2064 family)
VTTLIVLAKECLPGKVKTRLHPPLSLEQAARLAAASLDDTLAQVAGLPATRRVLAFDGEVPPAAAAGYDVVAQVEGGLDARIGAIFDNCTEPAVLIGMDTPQVTIDHLAPVFAVWPDDVDAWFGPAADGGFWALALREPDGDLIRGVPMSRTDTGARQLERLQEAGLRVRMLATLTDVDHIDDAHAVAALAPDGTFAATLAGFGAGTPNEVPR